MEENEHHRRLMEDARVAKKRKKARLERSRHFLAVERVDENGGLKLSEDRAAEINAEVQLWTVCERGDLPEKTFTLVAKTSRLPKRMAMPLVCAQDGCRRWTCRWKRYFESEPRLSATCTRTRRDHYQLVHSRVMSCLRGKLEAEAAAAADATMKQEQERLLEEEGQAVEERRSGGESAGEEAKDKRRSEKRGERSS